MPPETSPPPPNSESIDLPSATEDPSKYFIDTLQIIDDKIVKDGKRASQRLLTSRETLSVEVDRLSDPKYPENLTDMQQMSQVAKGIIERYNPTGRLQSYVADVALSTKLSLKRLS